MKDLDNLNNLAFDNSARKLLAYLVTHTDFIPAKDFSTSPSGQQKCLHDVINISCALLAKSTVWNNMFSGFVQIIVQRPFWCCNKCHENREHIFFWKFTLKDGFLYHPHFNYSLFYSWWAWGLPADEIALFFFLFFLYRWNKMTAVSIQPVTLQMVTAPQNWFRHLTHFIFNKFSDMNQQSCTLCCWKCKIKFALLRQLFNHQRKTLIIIICIISVYILHIFEDLMSLYCCLLWFLF